MLAQSGFFSRWDSRFWTTLCVYGAIVTECRFVYITKSWWCIWLISCSHLASQHIHSIIYIYMVLSILCTLSSVSSYG